MYTFNIYLYIYIYYYKPYCPSHAPSFTRYTNWERAAAMPTFDNEEYLRLSSTYRHPLYKLTGWDSSMIKYCSMHTVQLGLCQWVNGNSTIMLLERNFFGRPGLVRSEQLKIVTATFKRWITSQGLGYLSGYGIEMLIIYVCTLVCIYTYVIHIMSIRIHIYIHVLL